MDKTRKRQVVLGGVFVVLFLIWWSSGTSERQLLKQLRTGDAEERFAAIRGLEEIGSSKARAAIAEHTEDPDAKVASRAVLALGTLADQDNIKQLETGISNARPEVREAAAVAVGRCPPNVPVNHQALISQLSGEQSPQVRAAAAAALGFRRAQEGVPSLIVALSDPDAEVRLRAGEALRLITRESLYFPPYAPEKERQQAIEQIRATLGVR